MGLFSKFKIPFGSSKEKSPKKTAKSAAWAADPIEVVRQARLKARRRLIGAALLLLIGIIGFPLIFETQPRPVPVNIPIEIPAKDKAPPLQSAVRSSAPPQAQEPSTSALESAASPGVASTPDEEVMEPSVKPDANITRQSKQAVGTDSPAVDPASTNARNKAERRGDSSSGATTNFSPDTAHAAKPTKLVDAPLADSKQTAKKPAEKTDRAAKSDTSSKSVAGNVMPIEHADAKVKDSSPKDVKPKDAKGKDTKSSDTKATEPKAADAKAEEGRFVVQIGAFSEPGSARDARAKVELLGLSTYTQVVESSSGRRIRVRVGPFANRADADKAAAKIKAGGLPAAVLKL